MSAEPVIGVISGCGGVGASVFTAVLAACASRQAGHAFLIDCDPWGGGIDVLLGCEREPGSRWSQVRLSGGQLDPLALRDSLPRWHEISFLAADSASALDPAAIGQIIESAAGLSPVLVDLPRWPAPERLAAAARCDVVVLVTAAETRALTASAMLAPSLDPDRTSIVVRGSCRTLPHWHIAELLGLPVLGELPYDPASLRRVGLDLARTRRRTRRLAEAVLSSCRIERARPVAPSGIVAA